MSDLTKPMNGRNDEEFSQAACTRLSVCSVTNTWWRPEGAVSPHAVDAPAGSNPPACRAVTGMLVPWPIPTLNVDDATDATELTQSLLARLIQDQDDALTVPAAPQQAGGGGRDEPAMLLGPAVALGDANHEESLRPEGLMGATPIVGREASPTCLQLTDDELALRSGSTQSTRG